MDVLVAGLAVARRRPALTLVLFLGEGLAGLLPLAGLAVAAVALGLGFSTALAAGSDQPFALPLGVVSFMLRPRVILGVGGAGIISLLLAFGLSAFLRGGVLVTLREALRSDEPFDLTTFLRGGWALLDRVAPLALLEAIAPWCGLAFAALGVLPVLQLGTLTGPLPAALLAAGVAGGLMTTLTLWSWVQLALSEVALQPGLPASRALATSAVLLAGRADVLLRFVLGLLPLFVVPLMAYVVAVLLLTSATADSSFALIAPLLRTGLDLIYALFTVFLGVAARVALLLFYGRLHPAAAEAAGIATSPAALAVLRVGEPRPLAPGVVAARYRAAELASRGLHAPGARDGVPVATDAGWPQPPTINVFPLAELLAACRGGPAPGRKPVAPAGGSVDREGPVDG